MTRFGEKIIIPPINELRGWSKYDQERLIVASDAIQEGRVEDAKVIIGKLTHAGTEKLKKYSVEKERVTYDRDDLAHLLGVTKWETLEEMNLDFFWEVTHQNLGRVPTGSDDEEFYNAEQEVRDDLYQQWAGAVDSTADKFLERVGLQLIVVEHDPTGRPWLWEIAPLETWRNTANMIDSYWTNSVAVRSERNAREFVLDTFENEIDWAEADRYYHSLMR
jgi:hypothetical protein